VVGTRQIRAKLTEHQRVQRSHFPAGGLPNDDDDHAPYPLTMRMPPNVLAGHLFRLPSAVGTRKHAVVAHGKDACVDNAADWSFRGFRRRTARGRELRFPQVPDSRPQSCQPLTRTAANGRRWELTLSAITSHIDVRSIAVVD